MIIPHTAHHWDWGPGYYDRWTVHGRIGGGTDVYGRGGRPRDRDDVPVDDGGEAWWGWWPIKDGADARKSSQKSSSRDTGSRDASSATEKMDQESIIPKRQLMLDLDEPTTTRRIRTTAVSDETATTERAPRTSAAVPDTLADEPTTTGTRPRAGAASTPAVEDEETDTATSAARDSATSKRTRPTDTAETDTSDTSDTRDTPDAPLPSSTRTSLTSTDTDSPTSSATISSDPTESADPDAGGILSRGVASTKLEWWQLLCIALVCLLAIGVGGYMYWKQKKKKEDDRKRREQVEREEKEDKAREVALKEVVKAAAGGLAGGTASGGKEGGRKGGRSARWSDEESDEEDMYEDYDSMSDGGTIRPRRRYRPERREYAGRGYGRRRDEYARDRSRARGRRGERYGGYSDEYYTSDDSYGRPPRGRDRDRDRDRDRRNRRPYETPLSSSYRRPTPRSDRTPPFDHGGRSERDPKPRANFRDSVFSTFSAMKSAAVKLKRHEAEARLEKQLKEEEEVERRRLEVRRGKVKEANEEIERERVRELVAMELERGKKGAAGQEEANEQTSTANPKTTFTAHRTNLPLPSSRRPPTSTPKNPRPALPAPVRGMSTARTGGQHRTPTSRAHGVTLGRPTPGSSATQGTSETGGTQVVNMNNPRDRPTIPRGMLQPAPPPKIKGQARRRVDGGGAVQVSNGRGQAGSPYTGVVTAHQGGGHDNPDDSGVNAGNAGGQGEIPEPGAGESEQAQEGRGKQQQQQQQQGWGSTLAGWWQGRNAQQPHQTPDKSTDVIGQSGDGYEIPLPPASGRDHTHKYAGESVIPPVRSRTLAPAALGSQAQSYKHTHERQGSVLDDIIPAYGGFEIPKPASSKALRPAHAPPGAPKGFNTGDHGTSTWRVGASAGQSVPTAGLGLSMPSIPGISAGAGGGGGSGSARGHRGGWGGPSGVTNGTRGPEGVGWDLRTAATGGRAGIGAGGGKWADRLRSRR